MLGVYLPTIQHILGVTMFIRLFWVVGIAGIWHTMLLLLLCCSCVSNILGGQFLKTYLQFVILIEMRELV